MKIEITLIYPNEFDPEELVGQNIPEKYLINDNNRNELAFAATTLNSEREVTQLINFLFHNNSAFTEIYRDNNSYILNLSSLRAQRIDYNYLEEFFPKWIKETGRPHNMDEFGMLLDFVAHIKISTDKQYLLLIVTIVKI